jgi:N-acetylglutamate synthase-like GNAT family acetyltransferase
VLALLEAAGLPGGGVEEWLAHFVVAVSGERLVGVAGLEMYGSDALLRSVAVAEDWRGRGLGGVLTDEALGAAARAGVRAVYLLTETAERYFPRHGFHRIARGEASEAVRQSVEFRELCPASSTVMMRPLGAAR